MRGLFIVGAKLLGIYLLYWAIMSILVSISFLLHASSGGTPFSSELFEKTIVLMNFSIVLIFVFVLLFKTEWLADKIKLPGDSLGHTAVVTSANLRLGIVFIGIYIFVTHIGGLITVIWSHFIANRESDMFAATQPKGLQWSVDFVNPIITVLISFLLIFGSEQISRWLIKEKIDEI